MIRVSSCPELTAGAAAARTCVVSLTSRTGAAGGCVGGGKGTSTARGVRAGAGGTEATHIEERVSRGTAAPRSKRSAEQVIKSNQRLTSSILNTRRIIEAIIEATTQ